VKCHHRNKTARHSGGPSILTASLPPLPFLEIQMPGGKSRHRRDLVAGEEFSAGVPALPNCRGSPSGGRLEPSTLCFGIPSGRLDQREPENAKLDAGFRPKSTDWAPSMFYAGAGAALATCSTAFLKAREEGTWHRSLGRLTRYDSRGGSRNYPVDFWSNRSCR
jgi:hypothetical protein